MIIVNIQLDLTNLLCTLYKPDDDVLMLKYVAI